eukprot:3000900-Pleurochrysis_carterae.AAC.1
MRAVVEAPHARRIVDRARDDVLAVGSDADRVHVTAVPLERAQLRASGEGGHARARRLVSREDRSNCVHRRRNAADMLSRRSTRPTGLHMK